jgi:hypothetical protein
VTPILAWVSRAVFALRASTAEVEDFRFVPVASATAERAGDDPPGPQLGMMTALVLAELADVLAVDAVDAAQ